MAVAVAELVGDEMGEDVELGVGEDKLVLDVLETPITAASAISVPVPQHAVLCVPQHHFSLVGVPSQGVISAFPEPSTSCL